VLTSFNTLFYFNKLISYFVTFNVSIASSIIKRGKTSGTRVCKLEKFREDYLRVRTQTYGDKKNRGTFPFNGDPPVSAGRVPHSLK